METKSPATVALNPVQLVGRKHQNKRQLAAYLQLSMRQIEKMMQRRQIPYRKLGPRCVRFDIDAVDKALSRYEVAEINAEKGAK